MNNNETLLGIRRGIESAISVKKNAEGVVEAIRRDGEGWRFVRRIHRLFYGQAAPTSPLDQRPADWPEHHDGRGTLPEAWPSWAAFWAGSDPDGT